MPDQNLIAPLEKTLRELRDERTSAQARYNEAKENLEEAEREVQKLKGELQRAKSEVDDALARLQALTEHLDKLRSGG
jgi:chromosome segregation ATPase